VAVRPLRPVGACPVGVVIRGRLRHQRNRHARCSTPSRGWRAIQAGARSTSGQRDVVVYRASGSNEAGALSAGCSSGRGVHAVTAGSLGATVNYRLNPPACGVVFTAAGRHRCAAPVDGVAARGGLGVR
jgi:hypothetical protein